MTRWRLRKATYINRIDTSVPTVYAIAKEDPDGRFSFYLGSNVTDDLFYWECGFATADEAVAAALEYVKDNESRLFYQEGFGRFEEGAVMAKRGASYILQDTHGVPQAGVEEIEFDEWYELDEYLDQNPDVLERIDNGSAIVIEAHVSKNADFNNSMYASRKDSALSFDEHNELFNEWCDAQHPDPEQQDGTWNFLEWLRMTGKEASSKSASLIDDFYKAFLEYKRIEQLSTSESVAIAGFFDWLGVDGRFGRFAMCKSAFNQSEFVEFEWQDIGRTENDEADCFTNGIYTVYRWDDGKWSVMKDGFDKITIYDDADDYAGAWSNVRDKNVSNVFSIYAKKSAALNLDKFVDRANEKGDGLWALKVELEDMGDYTRVWLTDYNEFISGDNFLDGWIWRSAIYPIENAVQEQTGDYDFYFDSYDGFGKFVGSVSKTASRRADRGDKLQALYSDYVTEFPNLSEVEKSAVGDFLDWLYFTGKKAKLKRAYYDAGEFLEFEHWWGIDTEGDFRRGAIAMLEFLTENNRLASRKTAVSEESLVATMSEYEQYLKDNGENPIPEMAVVSRFVNWAWNNGKFASRKTAGDWYDRLMEIAEMMGYEQTLDELARVIGDDKLKDAVLAIERNFGLEPNERYFATRKSAEWVESESVWTLDDGDEMTAEVWPRNDGDGWVAFVVDEADNAVATQGSADWSLDEAKTVAEQMLADELREASRKVAGKVFNTLGSDSWFEVCRDQSNDGEVVIAYVHVDPFSGQASGRIVVNDVNWHLTGSMLELNEVFDEVCELGSEAAAKAHGASVKTAGISEDDLYYQDDMYRFDADGISGFIAESPSNEWEYYAYLYEKGELGDGGFASKDEALDAMNADIAKRNGKETFYASRKTALMGDDDLAKVKDYVKMGSSKTAMNDEDFATMVDDAYQGALDFIEEGYTDYGDVQSEVYSYIQSWCDAIGSQISSDEEDEAVQIVMDELENDGLVS